MKIMAKIPSTLKRGSGNKLQAIFTSLNCSRVRTRTLLAVASLGLIATFGCAQQRQLDERSLDPRAQMSPAAISIAPVELSFAKYWLKDQRFETNKTDIDRLQRDYGEALTYAVDDYFTEQQWSPSASPDTPNKVSVKLSDVRITAPDYKRMITDQYAKDELGSATFELVLTQAGKTTVQCKDDRDVNFGIPGKLQEVNQGINKLAFKKEMERFLSDCLNPERE